jgi:spermidine synthase
MLNSLPFYQNCRARLSSNGIVAINLLSDIRGYQANLDRIHTAFDGRSLALPDTDSGNSIVLAATGEPVRIALDELREQALALKEKTGLNLLPTVSRLERAQFCTDGVLSLQGESEAAREPDKVLINLWRKR